MSMHSNVLLSVSVLSATLLVATVSRLTAADSRAVFEGVWRTVEVVVPGPTPQTFRSAATLAIFHGKYYSRVEVHAEGVRPVLKDPATASADELRAVWGPFVAEAGTFEVTGKNVVAMQAMVAKNPADDQRRDERLHLSAERRYADIEADSHARWAERRSRDDQAGARRVIRRRVHPGVGNVTGMDGLSPDGTRWVHARPSFFLPVKVLSRVFRGKVLSADTPARRVTPDRVTTFIVPDDTS